MRARNPLAPVLRALLPRAHLELPAARVPWLLLCAQLWEPAPLPLDHKCLLFMDTHAKELGLTALLTRPYAVANPAPWRKSLKRQAK